MLRRKILQTINRHFSLSYCPLLSIVCLLSRLLWTGNGDFEYQIGLIKIDQCIRKVTLRRLLHFVFFPQYICQFLALSSGSIIFTLTLQCLFAINDHLLAYYQLNGIDWSLTAIKVSLRWSASNASRKIKKIDIVALKRQNKSKRTTQVEQNLSN